MTLSDEQYVALSRVIATQFLDIAARLHLSPEDTANLAGCALGEVLAQQLNPFGAVTRLRDMADTFEKQLLDAG